MSRIRFYHNGRDVTDDNRNQNYEGVSNIMDDYEIRNLASILDRLNKAEAENQKLRNELANIRNSGDNAIIRKCADLLLNECAEIEVSFKMKNYFHAIDDN